MLLAIVITSVIAFLLGYFVGSNNPYPKAKANLEAKIAAKFTKK